MKNCSNIAENCNNGIKLLTYDAIMSESWRHSTMPMQYGLKMSQLILRLLRGFYGLGESSFKVMFSLFDAAVQNAAS